MRKPAQRLAGVAEIADALGVSKQTVTNWKSRHASFPAPLITLRMGPIWYLGTVLRWHARQGR